VQNVFFEEYLITQRGKAGGAANEGRGRGHHEETERWAPRSWGVRGCPGDEKGSCWRKKKSPRKSSDSRKRVYTRKSTAARAG